MYTFLREVLARAQVLQPVGEVPAVGAGLVQSLHLETVLITQMSLSANSTAVWLTGLLLL